MRSKPILIPDTNVWRSKPGYTLLSDLVAAGEAVLGAYYPIAFECMTADSVGISRAALGRMLESTSVWCRDKEAIISEVVGLSRNDWQDPLRVIASEDEASHSGCFWREAYENISHNFDHWHKRKADHWTQQKEYCRRLRDDFWDELKKTDPEMQPGTSDLEDIVRRCLSVDDAEWGGALLQDGIIRRYLLSNIELRKLLLALPRFPGFRLFYCHALWNFLGQAEGRAIDGSFLQDSHCLLPTGQNTILVTNDTGLLDTQRRFGNEDICVASPNEIERVLLELKRSQTKRIYQPSSTLNR